MSKSVYVCYTKFHRQIPELSQTATISGCNTGVSMHVRLLGQIQKTDIEYHTCYVVMY
jgi:hypothetical protein